MKVALSIFIILGFHFSKGQILFSFERNYISENTYCFELPESSLSEMGIQQQLTLFHEQSLEEGGHDAFRITTYGAPGDLRPVVVRRIEPADTTCIVTTKYISNWRKREVLCHSKTYDIGKWTDFKDLVRRNFRERSLNSDTKVYHYEDAHEDYEIIEAGKYKKIEGSNANPDITMLLDYLEYLISPIFEDECPREGN